MTEFLIKHFIKDYKEVEKMSVRTAYGVLASIVGIFCKRVQLLVGGFQIPNLDYAGPMTQDAATDWASGMAGIYQGMVYWPTPLEFGVALGVIGLGALMLLLGLKYLPLKPTERSH